jgi:heat shock protein HslJ
MVGARAAFALGVALGVAPGPVWAMPELPAALTSPAQRVVCNSERGVCYDRQGPSIGLTEIFLGKATAERLLAWLREHPADRRPGAVFSPAEGIECVFETGPCRDSAQTLAGLTAVLFGPWSEREPSGADSPPILGTRWRWLVTRYPDGTEARPAEPAHFLLLLAADSTTNLRADCNRAGGRYRLDGNAIAIEITHSTMAACEPGSLDRTFLDNLAAVNRYFLRTGRLYLDFKDGAGAMEFAR